ncbi:MAG: hypothetical protein HZA15_15425 [Nitrospirae bacterium]|nr:hypothetical protein [Nitrospirota bacterium]
MGPNSLMLGAASIRAFEIRARLISLNELGIGGEILRMYEATEEDLDMLAVIEEERKSKEERPKDE